MKRAILSISILAMAAIACQLTDLVSQGASVAEPEGPGQALFEDDFSDSGSGWDIVPEATEYYEGTYRIFVAETSIDRWANPGRNFGGDIRIDVDITKAGGPDDNNFGVICRYDDSEGFNYYAFQISSDGYALISRVDNGVATGISSDLMQPHDAILQGGVTNHVQVFCTGDQLSLWVNGENVESATDATYASGDVGLIAGTYETAGADIRFDNFTVRAE